LLAVHYTGVKRRCNPLFEFISVYFTAPLKPRRGKGYSDFRRSTLDPCHDIGTASTPLERNCERLNAMNHLVITREIYMLIEYKICVDGSIQTMLGIL
jgi:hypothetical protein